MPIYECYNCKPNKYQDKKYGKNKRVFTTTNGKDSSKIRCTVCGTVKESKK